uniref:Globin family profile domain-containing protein n=1 Tax=Plectus sambesii TaxID=2011161 RepID=A0A914WQY5_9BILA
MGKSNSKNTVVAELSIEEIAAIRDSWTRAKNYNIGKKILFSLIEKRPKFAEYFGIPSDAVTFDGMQNSRELQLQAHRIQGFLDTAVGALGYCPISSVYDMAHRIGQIHFYRGVNFGADNWLVFKRVTVEQVAEAAATSRNGTEDSEGNGLKTLNDNEESSLFGSVAPIIGARRDPVTEICWNRLMTLIIREMKRGFLEEAMRNCKE